VYSFTTALAGLPPTANFTFTNGTICTNSNNNFTNTSIGATSYSWTFQNGNPAASSLANPTVTFATAGSKQVTLIVTNNYGSDTLAQTITVEGLPIASIISAIGTTTICTGDSVSLVGNNGGVWSNAATTANITVTTGGLYSVTTTNACGSAISNSIDITLNTVDTSVMIGNASLLANATNATYQWLLCNGIFTDIPGETNQIFQPTTIAAFYAVEVTQNGCVDTSSCHIFFYTDIASSKVNSDADVSIYPNPAINSFTINGIQNKKVTILNNLGEEVFINTNFSALETIDVSGLAKGCYFVRMNERVLKFMKE
jgi:PKD repeat protein